MKHKGLIFGIIAGLIVAIIFISIIYAVDNNKEIERVKSAVLKEDEANIIHIEKAEDTGFNGDFYFVWVVNSMNNYSFKIVEITKDGETIVRSYMESGRYPLFE